MLSEDIVEEVVGEEELQVDIEQLAGTAIDGVAAHLVEVVGHVPASGGSTP